MPFKTDKLSLNDPFLDRRTKLLPCQKEMVIYWYKEGTSIRGLSRMFKVDRRTIDFIVHPERLVRNKELREERGGSNVYYNREKHTKAIREHRQHKYKTLST